MEIFCKGIIHPIQVDDLNYYNISDPAEVNQLLQVTSLESEDTKKADQSVDSKFYRNCYC